jgi:hypothetical protein
MLFQDLMVRQYWLTTIVLHGTLMNRSSIKSSVADDGTIAGQVVRSDVG